MEPSSKIIYNDLSVECFGSERINEHADIAAKHSELINQVLLLSMIFTRVATGGPQDVSPKGRLRMT